MVGLFSFLGFPHNPSDWHQIGYPMLFPSKAWRLCSCRMGNKYPDIPIAPLSPSECVIGQSGAPFGISQDPWIPVGISRSFGCLWSCKRASQCTDAFSVFGSVVLCPSTISNDTMSTFASGGDNIKDNSLVDMNKLLLPPIHMKLDLMKNFVNSLDKKWCCFLKPAHFIPSSQTH